MTGFLATIAASAFAHDLTPAPGRRTQTISPYAGVALVSRAPASTAPCPSFATMAHAPLVEQDGGNYGVDLPGMASDLFLAAGLDGPNQFEIAEEISLLAQRLFLVTSSERHGSFPIIASAAAS